jgi:UrcA family protein
LGSSMAQAQSVDRVNVKATRAMTTKIVGRTSSGIPIADVSIRYKVSTQGLDLRWSAGAGEFARRVRNAAWTACREIGRQYPGAQPGDAECAEAAADKAMVRARELIALARDDIRAR